MRPWWDIRESGSRLGIRLALGVLRLLGYRVARWLVAIIAFYYTLFAPGARRAVRDFQVRAMGRSSLVGTWKTIFCFAESVLDRATVLTGRSGVFRLNAHGEEAALERHRSGEGVMVLSAHLGTMEMGRAFNIGRGVTFSFLVYSALSSRLHDEFRRINPSMDLPMIEIDPGGIGHVLEARERLARGEFIGVLGDRTWQRGPVVRLPFLGVERDFPAGPYHMAIALKCPIMLMFMVKEGARDYHLYIEEFATPDDLPGRADREAGVAAMAARFASRLEHHCRLHPHQWYNFFDFWAAPEAREPVERPATGDADA